MSFSCRDINNLLSLYGMCFGNIDGLPIRTAIEFFGRDAVDFACRLHTPGKHDDGYKATYGIDGYTVEFLTVSGCRVAASYVNCLEEKEKEQEAYRAKQVKENCRVITLFPEQQLKCKRGRCAKPVSNVGFDELQEMRESSRWSYEVE